MHRFSQRVFSGGLGHLWQHILKLFSSELTNESEYTYMVFGIIFVAIGKGI